MRAKGVCAEKSEGGGVGEGIPEHAPRRNKLGDECVVVVVVMVVVDCARCGRRGAVEGSCSG